MRVLLHVDYLSLGGIEKKVRDLALGLDRQRFEPMVSWSNRWGVVGDQLTDAGIPAIRVSPSHAGGDGIRQIRDIAPDLFHSFSCAESSADAVNAREAGVPLVVTSRDSIQSVWTDPPLWVEERNSATDRIVACGRAVAEASLAAEGISADRLAVIHNGVPIPSAARHERASRCVGYAATYRALKAHEVLLGAFAEVRQGNPDARLLCCGEVYDDSKEKAERMAGELALNGSVRLLGPQTAMDEIYEELDVYVHPSLSEGFSLAILEAMARGLAVVAAAVGGNAEAVSHGVSGLLVAPGDAGALAAAVAHLLNNRDLCRRMGQVGRERVAAQFSLGAMVRGYEALYLELAGVEPGKVVHAAC
jgi:glycosyltransferase involved in cell wall biosynthesis